VQNFIIGQRWISDTESQMGLGTIQSVDHRTVTVHFPATDEARTYAQQTAPLTRVMFAAGDHVVSQNNATLKVETATEKDGLIRYLCSDENDTNVELHESQLNHFLQLNRPSERLFNGQIDKHKWYELRYQTRQHDNRLLHSDLYGLTGARTSLIPHQLYIANEVANRYAPRVLLADEVGLGKTIEAGLILHHQLLTERAKRALIIVPESLVHQWLVEMLRRFNLFFSIFDEERCQAIEENNEHNNPFYSEQLSLCSLEYFTQHPNRFQQALAGEWDMLIVDEAHHLQWSPEQSSLEYTLVEQLAAVTPGVLLLTATPEQLGKASHFARLRLLDPNRFPDFETFSNEEKSYEPIAHAIKELLSDQPLSEGTLNTLSETIKEDENQDLLELLEKSSDNSSDTQDSLTKNKLIEHLIDRHGTGRALFRNTRSTIKGFPLRKVIATPLALPKDYAASINTHRNNATIESGLLLCPELLYQSNLKPNQPHWTQIDPRINWLIELLNTHLKSEKILLITADAQTALDISHSLRIKEGIQAAVFHEGLSIVERDRAAAFFADPESGSQILICSEIGSEGRNFQFAHHMILFDLPLNPDLLEQRIGRLDRIGQKQDIKIHVPYLNNSAQKVMFHWYHEGLNAFEKTCPAGHTVFKTIEASLIESLHTSNDNLEDLPKLIATTQKLHQESNDALQRGRDRLLEYNSCRPVIANNLRDRALEQDKTSVLESYMERVYDCFGIDSEEHSKNCHIIAPGENMLSRLPGLPDDGMTITYERDTALENEDIQYITWQHPLVINAMDMVASHELGNTAANAIKYKNVKPGTLLLESVYILESTSNNKLQSRRYLPPTSIRIVMDEEGNDHSDRLSHQAIRKHQILINSETANKIVQTRRQSLQSLVASGENHAHSKAPAILKSAHTQSTQTLTKEINRLKALRLVNPNVRNEEIKFFETQLESLTLALDSASLRLDTLRVMVAM